MNQLKPSTSNLHEKTNHQSTGFELDQIDRALLAMNFYEIEQAGIIPPESEFQYRENRRYIKELAEDKEMHSEIKEKLNGLVSRDILPKDAAEEILHMLTADPKFRIHLPETYQGEEVLAVRKYQLITGSIADSATSMRIEGRYTKRDLIEDFIDFLDNPNNNLTLLGRSNSYIINAFIEDSLNLLNKNWKITRNDLMTALQGVIIRELGFLTDNIQMSEAKAKIGELKDSKSE